MKIKVGLSIGYPNAAIEDKLEIEDKDLEGMSEEEKERKIDMEVQEWAGNFIETWWEPCEEEK